VLCGQLRSTAKTGNRPRRPVAGKVVGCLQIEPELGGRVEGLREEPSRFGRNTPFASNQLIDALHRDPEVLRESDLGLAQGHQELLKKNLAGMGGNAVFRLHWLPLVVVEESNVVRGSLAPAKDHAPLFVDTDAVESAPATPEGLEPVTWRRAQIREHTCGIDHIELPNCDRQNVARKRTYAARSRTVVEIGGGLVAERRDHRVRLSNARHPCKFPGLFWPHNGWPLSCGRA